MPVTVAFESAYRKLNPTQKKAVDSIEGPVLVLAGPGTGKTQVLTVRIANILKETDTEPSSILALTYTDAAAREMKERLISLIGQDGYYVKIGTFHALCNEIIADNPDRFARPAGMQNVTELERVNLISEVLEKNSFKLLKPVNAPLMYVKDIIGSISILKREGITLKKFSELVSILKDEFEIEKGGMSKTARTERETLVNKNIDLLFIYEKYQEKLKALGRLDFEDMINWVVEAFENDADFLQQYEENFQYILVDEYQDTNSAQNRLVFALSSFWGERSNIFCVGDNNQCLPGDTKINTAGGEKNIKDIQIGESVLSAVGKGYTSYIKVTNVFSQTKKVRLITLTTESGKTVTATDNHKMFCYIPPREETSYWYNYLMFKEGVGWRLGITRGLSIRLKTESGADKIVGIASHNTEWEARCAETIYSLKYQIPTIVFQPRGGKVSQEYIKVIFAEFDTLSNAKRLADDLGINLMEPHYSREATTLGKGRVKINFMMCSRSYRTKYAKVGLLEHPEVLHEINIQTSNKKVLDKLSKLGFKLKNKNIGKGFRITSTDIKQLFSIAENLERELPGFIDIKSSIGTNSIQHRSARVMQMGNLLIGNYLPVLNGFEIKYEKIISRTEEIKVKTVFDLEVTPSHNFIANGIVVHNSIFRFQGASKENLLAFEKRFPGHTSVKLVDNYRSTPSLLQSSAALMGETPLNPKVKYRDVLVKTAKFSSSVLEDEFVCRSIKKKKKKGIPPEEMAVIVKENRDIDNLINIFKQKNIPYRLEGGTDVLRTPLVGQFLKILKVVTGLQGPVDDIDLFTILNYPYLGLKPLPILRAARYAHENRKTLVDSLQDAHPEIDRELIEKFNLLVSWNSRSASHTLPEMFQIIFQESGLLDYVLALPQPIIELNRFGTLYEDVKAQAAATSGLDIFGYVFNLGIMEENGLKLPEQTLVSDTKAVTLTTAHKAKGLEWKLVYIYRFADTHWGNTSRRQMIKLPPGIINEQDVSKEDKNAEERRLFYVAMTRAKQELYIVGSTKYSSSVKMVYPSLFLSDLPKETIKKIKTLGLEKKAAKILASLMQVPIAPTIHEGEKEYLLQIIKDFKLSPTALNTFLKCPYKFKLDNLYKIPRAKAPPMCFGTAVHFALERLYLGLNNGEKLESKKDFLRDFEVALAREVLTEAEYKTRLEHGREILSAYYDRYEKEFEPSLFTEKKFGDSLSSSVMLGDIPLSGKADRIDLTSKEDKHVRFTDYKTGAPKSRNEIEGNTKNSDGDYKRQLVFYTILADLDKSFKYKVVQSVIDFIEPDKGGVFKREHFNITEEEVGELKEVIKASVADIRKLKFDRTTVYTTCATCEFKNHCWPNGVPLDT